MSFQNLFVSQFSDNALTLSGEILVTSILTFDNKETDSLNSQTLEQGFQRMRAKYPFLQIDPVKGLTEFSIKFFCHKARLAQINFLDCFQEDLCSIVGVILGNEKLCVRVNVFGTYETVNSIQEYRYLNKKDDVRYKITNEIRKGRVAQLMRPVVYLVILLVSVCGYFGYQGYQYFFDEKNQVRVEEKIDDKQDSKGEKSVSKEKLQEESPKSVTSGSKM